MRTLWNRGVVYSKRLRGSYGSSLIVLLFAQVALVGGIFVAYAWAGLHWDVPTTMKAWLGVTALEACGIALITMHHLFPHKDQQRVPAYWHARAGQSIWLHRS